MIDLAGCYDLHIHAAPDVTKRKFTDLELAKHMAKAGFAGFGLKCHFSETVARAALIREKFPELEVVGGITLNRSVGGFNPYAVEMCGKMGGKFVWMPTLEARNYKCFHNPQISELEAAKYLSVFDSDKKLLSSVHEVMEVAAQYNLIVATGHLDAEEGLAVIKAAKSHKVKKIVVTHADNPANYYTLEQQLACVKEGAIIEHSFFTVYKKRTSPKDIVAQIRAVGFDNTFISTDFGQDDNPYPDEGIKEFLEILSKQGIRDRDLEKLVKINPQELIK
ncbi:MAG: DUF6282 family protein [Acidaminococcaceae bacterium]|jgi:sugar phosphate isomerase/epimerase|nr:DUF6282 family protein [Acidaminococcaceae bacterium]